MVNIRQVRHVLFPQNLLTPRPSIPLGALILTLLLSLLPLAMAQDSPSSKASKTEKESEASLRRGTNEFGGWAGYSPSSFKLKGTTEDRKLFLLNLQYARTLLATDQLTFKYTAEVVPVALEMQHTEAYLVGGNNVVNPAGTVYGAGASPVGFQGNFGRKSVQPFVNGGVGFLYFRQQVPILGSSQFNYTISMGVGAQFLRRSGRSFIVGWKYFHLSNNYQATLNPGIDSGLFYVGFSILRAGRR